MLSVLLSFCTNLFENISTFCFILDIVLWFLSGETVKITPHYVRVTSPTTKLVHLYSSLKRNSISSRANKSTLKSGPSVLIVANLNKLAHLFSSIKRNGVYIGSNKANLNSGSSTLSNVNGSILLTGKRSRGKKIL